MPKPVVTPKGNRAPLLELATRWLHVPAVAVTRRDDKYKYLQYRGLTVEEIEALFLSLCTSSSVIYFG
jgi:hypothetical protein